MIKTSSTITAFGIGAATTLVLPFIGQSLTQNTDLSISFVASLLSFGSFISYSLMSVAILFWSYRYIDWLIPADIEAEIFEKKNLAAGVFKGMMILSIALILAAVIISP